VPSVPPLPPDRPDLELRYGLTGPRWPGYLPLAAVGLALVGMLAATAWGLVERSTGVRAGVLTYGDITPASITITVEVVRDPVQPVICDVAAVGENQIDVGAALIEIPPGEDDRVVVSATIETASPPKAARLLGCRPVESGEG
jgi:hypothetical protein